MNKTYELNTTKFFLPMQINWSNQHKPFYHAVAYWESLGGSFYEKYNYILGTDEILAEFILTYPYSQYITIKEITQ